MTLGGTYAHFSKMIEFTQFIAANTIFLWASHLQLAVDDNDTSELYLWQFIYLLKRRDWVAS